jgi:hypothetical protein
MRKVHRGFGEATWKKKKSGRPGHRWEDNTKMNLQDLGWGGGVNWIGLVQDWKKWQAVVYSVMNLQIP